MKKNSSPLIIVFVAALVSVAWFAWQAWSADSDVVLNNERVRRSQDKIRQLEQIAYLTQSLESAMRGYVITGDTGFLRQGNFLEARLRAPVENLFHLTGGDAVAQMQADSLKAAVFKKIAYFNYIFEAAKESPVVAGAMIRTRNAASVPDELTQLNERMLAEENQRAEDLLGTHWFNRLPAFVPMIGSICCIIILLGALRRIAKNIRKAEETEIALRQSEQKYRQLIEDAGTTMFTTNRGGFFTYVNKKAFELTGYTSKELINQQYLKLLEPPQQRELRTFYENQAFDGQSETTMEFPIRMKDGTRKWVEQHVVLVYSNGRFKGYQCIVKDIHQKKIADEQLLQTKNEMNILHQRLQSILANTTSIIFIKDVLGRYLLVNKRFEDVFGLRSEQVLNHTDKDFPDILKPGDHLETDRNVILFERPQEMEVMIELPDKTHYFFITKFPLRDHTRRVYGLCGIATDITDRIEHEHKLMNERKKADSARRKQELFMANMSHELRTPLNGIIGITNLLKSLDNTPKTGEYLQDIHESAHNLLALVNDLLDFSRIKAGKFKLSREEFAPRELIRQLAEKYRQPAEEKGLAYHIDIADALRDHVTGDPTRLRQILSNLLDNAIKFTETGSVQLSVAVQPLDEQTLDLQFAVIDTGIGIPTELHDHIWEGFSQAHVGNERKYGGTGLGLALSRQLVNMQSGDITIAQHPPKGTVVRVSIPYQRSVQGQSRPQTPAPALTLLHGKHILLAEDNPMNQKVAIRHLERVGAHVALAENGREALDKLKEDHFDCILMDVQMPEMDGLRATQQIREDGSGIPIIALTASALRGDRERCLLAGMNDYLSKPFAPNDLYGKIIEALDDEGRAPGSLLDLPEHAPASATTFIDLQYLRNIVDNDLGYLQEVVGSFLQRAPGMFTRLHNAVVREAWQEVVIHASLLRSSLSIIKVPAVAEMMVNIEQDARRMENLPGIAGSLELAQKLYFDAEGLLREELEALKKQSED
ncbi:PAS domain S-box protein [Chitinophaga lutea]